MLTLITLEDARLDGTGAWNDLARSAVDRIGADH
jgi:hypothetical protein